MAQNAEPSSPEVVVVDYDMGNLGSIVNMLRKLGLPSRVAATPDALEGAELLILPGVGAFDSGMANLESRGLIEPLRRRVIDEGVPILGICLGLQLLTAKSEEGERPGLGWLDAETVRFDFTTPSSPPLKIPHMGWNEVDILRPAPLFEDAPPEPRYYFVHSYHVRCADPDDVLATTTYGHAFPSAVGRDNVYGVQFHPEKSHAFGMHLLRRFVEGAR